MVDTKGGQVGILSLSEALKRAQEKNLDLVEVAPMAKPPVVKIVDFQKYLFAKKRRGAKSKAKTQTSETKELRFGPNIGPKDLNDRISRAKEFLEAGNKIKLTIHFKGRQITHPEVGMEKLNKAVKELTNYCVVEQEIKKDGRFLYTILKPK